MSPQAFRPLVLAWLVIASSACQPQIPNVHAKNTENSIAGYVKPRASPIGAHVATYFGDLFSREEDALASKPPELASPTF